MDKILIELHQDTNPTSLRMGKYYARIPKLETVGLDEIYDNIDENGMALMTSRGHFKGIFLDVAESIFKLLLRGYTVKIPDLGLFKLQVINPKNGFRSPSKFDEDKLVGYKVEFRATGNLRPSQLTTAIKGKYPIRVKTLGHGENKGVSEN